MKEFVERFTLAPGAGETIEQVIKIPLAFPRWTLHSVPIDSGPASATEITYELQYWVVGGYYTRNPAGSAAMILNRDNVITSEDVVEQVKIKITVGTPAPSGGIVIDLYGGR